MKITKKAFHLLRSQLVVNVGGRWCLKSSQRKQTGIKGLVKVKVLIEKKT